MERKEERDLPAMENNQKKTMVTFQVPIERLEAFEAIAKEHGATASECLNHFIEQVVITGKLPLQETDELKTALALEDLRNQVYKGYLAMREGRVMTLDELEEDMAQW